MTIEEQVNEGIKNAMKAQDKIRLETMRNIKKSFWKRKRVRVPAITLKMASVSS